jgi:hypothetical protein
MHRPPIVNYCGGGKHALALFVEHDHATGKISINKCLHCQIRAKGLIEIIGEKIKVPNFELDIFYAISNRSRRRN